jgi:hypothetical protein
MLGNMLDRLRPKSDTAEAIAEALAAVEKALGEQRGRVADLEARRGAALLEGGETARRHEAALREARDEAERLTALAEALREKHAQAERRERRARLERMVEEARRKAETAGRAIAREYPRLAAKLVALLEAEREALAAIVVAERELAAGGEDAEGIAPIPRPRDYYAAPNPFGGGAHLCQVITLPRHDGSEAAHGSPPLWRGRDHHVIAGTPVV